MEESVQRDADNLTADPPATEDEDLAKVIFLVSLEKDLYAFHPDLPGRTAYRRVGTVACRTSGSPQSMAIDQKGTAWIFYDSRELFKVSTRDASCQPTDYRHPTYGYQLGMGFTRVGADLKAEKLFIQSPDFGFGSIGLPNLKVDQTGRLQHFRGELTGGADGKLFMFLADVRSIVELDPSTLTDRPVHTLEDRGHINAFAFGRYRGRFYIFSAPGGRATTSTIVYDPKADEESVRDAEIGFTVVGAGQTTLVPASDIGPALKGEPPPERPPSLDPPAPSAEPTPRPTLPRPSGTSTFL